MIAIDWSHTKGLSIYDGKKVSVLDRKALLKRLAGESIHTIKSTSLFHPASPGAGGGESIGRVESTAQLNPHPAPFVVIEQGCPLSLIYDILKTDSQVSVISNRATQDYRVEHGIEKTDENDARIIYELSNNGAKLTPVGLDDTQIQLVELYQRYKRYQKARVATMNMKKGYIRQFGEDGESRVRVKSNRAVNPSPAKEEDAESNSKVQSKSALQASSSDGVLPYDIAIEALKSPEKDCLKKIIKLSPPIPEGLKIRGLGPRLWAGIYITANPANFPTLSRYLRYCGLVSKEQIGTKWNRHACMLYHLLAEEVMKQRDGHFRPVYDKCKADIAERYPEYTKLHIHNAALNRTATFLAKEIWGKRKV